MDSLRSRADSTDTVADTAAQKSLAQRLGIRISKDALPSIVTATARDSAVLNMRENLFYLYGKAKTNYEDLQLTAGQIAYQQANNIVTAAPYPADTSGDKQTFKQGKETFTYDSMQYNFKSKRAIVRNVRSQYGEGYVFSEQVKRNPDQSIYGANSIYTTCALDTPHFGILAKRIKVIPGKVIVSGPANLSIEGIPTPLFVPFGIFPVSQKHRSGFIIPTYTIEQQRGLGLLGGGYYFYINDHVDLQARTTLFTKGSYSINTSSEYRNTYHYSGGLNLSYAYNKTGEDFEPGASVRKDFRINWRHQSDGKAVPGQSFNASVDAGSSGYYANNSYDANQVLQNQYQSNVSYSKNWQNRPIGLTVSALHRQNTANKQVNMTLPAVNFYISQINPFQRKNSIGTHWYDKVTTSYTMDLQNQITFYDSTLDLGNLSLSSFQNGVRHSVPVSASYTVLKYLNMSFNVNYNEYWLTNRLYTQFNPATLTPDSNNNYGFYASRDFNAGFSLSTRVYGMKMFRRGGLRGIRHVISPSVGFSYHPDFGASPFNYYYRSRIDSYTYVDASPYVTSIIGQPPLGKAGLVNMAVSNNLQIKVRSSKDTATGYKNIVLIDRLSVNSSYNIAVDSFQLSPVRFDFQTNIAEIINVNSSATYSPYAREYETGRLLPNTLYAINAGDMPVGRQVALMDLDKRFLRFTNANISLGSNFHSKPKNGGKSPSQKEEYKRVMRQAGYNEYVDFSIPWSFNFTYSLNADKTYSVATKKDTLVVNHFLTFASELQITPRWKLTMTSGYNFTQKQVSITSIDIYRDLHCWAMHLQTFPFGPRKSFNFTLNVKSTILQDLKLVRRRDFRDTPL